MDINVDPRVWNLFVGAVVAAGCGARTATQDGEEGPECSTYADCPAGYGCYDGACMYYPHHDGWVPYYECYSDGDCGEFSICEFGYCSPSEIPPPQCDPLEAMAIPVDGEALALTFADVDADGVDELVVATDASLIVYESDGTPPSVSPREFGTITSMIAGDFDDAPGEDLRLLIGNWTTMSYASNGDGSFAAAVTESTKIEVVSGLLAGDFDGIAPTDVLGWGPSGVYVERSGEITVFDYLGVDAAAAFEFGSASPGYFTRRTEYLTFYDLDAQEVAMTPGLTGPSSLAAFRSGAGGPGIATITHVADWSRIEARDPFDAYLFRTWVIPGTPSEVLAGDLDGDAVDELVFNHSAGLAIELDPLGNEDCWNEPSIPTEGVPRAAAFGDYDGDGDQELGILSSLGEVALIDGG